MQQDFRYEPCPERFNGMWGKLVSEDPKIFVWVRKRPNISRGTGSEFVVSIEGAGFGFMAAEDGRRQRTYTGPDGTFVRCIDVIFHYASETYRELKSGRLITEHLNDRSHFESLEQQQMVVDVLQEAISVYGAHGWMKPSPGRIEFSDEIRANLSSGAYIKLAE